MTTLKQCLKLFGRAVAHFQLYLQRHEVVVHLLETMANIQTRMSALSDPQSFQTFAGPMEALPEKVAAQQVAAFEGLLQEACTQMCEHPLPCMLPANCKRFA